MERSLKIASDSAKSKQTAILQVAVKPMKVSERAVPADKAIVIAKKGSDYIVVKLEEIACFYTEQKLVYLLTKEAQKLLLDGTLAGLEERLDPGMFFRVNRQSIVSIHYIKKFRTCQRLKIEIELDLPGGCKILSSQSAAALFRKWIYAH